MKKLLLPFVILFSLLTAACGGTNGLLEGSTQTQLGSVFGGGGFGGGNLSPGLVLESPEKGPDLTFVNLQAFGIWRESSVATESYILRVRDITELVAIYESFLLRLETTTTSIEVEQLELELRMAVARFFLIADRSGRIMEQQVTGSGVNICTYDLDCARRWLQEEVQYNGPFDPQSRRALQFECQSNSAEAVKAELPPE